MEQQKSKQTSEKLSLGPLYTLNSLPQLVEGMMLVLKEGSEAGRVGIFRGYTGSGRYRLEIVGTGGALVLSYNPFTLVEMLAES